MSKEMKMASVFSLPVESVDYQNLIKDGKDEPLLFIDFHEHEKEALCHAINSHDRLVEENAALREALLTVTRELHSTIQRLNEYERKDFRCDQLDPPEPTDMQTVHEAHLLLKELGADNENQQAD